MTVTDLVDRERARLRIAMVLVGLTLATGVIAVLLALATFALGEARWIELPRPLPLLAWVVATAIVGGAVWWTVRAWTARASRARVAEAIECERSLRAGSLRGALEVAGTGALGRRGADQLLSRLRGEETGPTAGRARSRRTSAGAASRRVRGALAPELQRGARWRAGVGLATASIACATLGAARSASPDGWRALAHPMRAWQGTLAPALAVDAPPVVLRGERVQIRIAAADRREITLHQRATGTAWRSSRHPVAEQRAVATVGPVDADLVLVADDGRTTSDTVVIRVTDRPFVGDVSLRASFPAYLRREAEVLPTGEPARLPRGSVVNITGHASIALAEAELTRGRDTVRLAVDGHSFRGRLVVNDAGQWSWSARGSSASIADVPPPIEIDVIPDSVPQVEIVEPPSDTVLTGSETVSITVAAIDDHGLATIVLQSWRQPASGKPQPAVEARLGPPAGAQWSGVTPIDLRARGLQPGDALHVVAIATDGSPWSQSAMSREVVIRIPTTSEQRELARAAADSAVAAATAAARAQRELERRTGDAARARGQRSTDPQSSSSGSRDAMSYDQAEQARALAAEQKAMVDRVEELKNAAASMEEQLRQAGALDSGLAARLAEARAMLDEALTPEFAEQMRKLEEALRNLSGDEARGAMSDLQEQQRRLREQLEKSAEMLKRAALEGMMQTLRDEATELAAAERALADSLARGLPPRDSAAARRDNARELEQRSRELSTDVSQLSQRLAKENAETGARKTNAAQQQAQASAEAMQRASESMGANQPDSPAQRGNQQGNQSGQQQGSQQGQQRGAQAATDAASAMERAAQQLADARASQIDEWKSELTGELDRSIQEMLQLGRQQEQLEQQLRQGADRNDLRGDQSALQQGVQKAGERLEAAGQKSSLLSPQSQRAAGEARAKVEQATRELTEGRNQGQTAGAMRDASEALNQAAASLVRDRDRANSASSASGFAEMLQQLQEMAQRQGGLNAQAAGLMQIPGGLQSPQAQEGARQLAREQRSLARDLQNLGDPTGRSDDLAREAQRIAETLDAGRIDAATIQRQQQLFRRMLDAGRTLEQDERDESGKREAQAAQPGETVTPTAPARGQDAVRFREPTWSELRGLTPEERRTVLEYFKRINGGGPP
jgi:hypothetical protein